MTTRRSGKEPKGFIAPGRCGFYRCKSERIGGLWHEGGSYLCQAHFEFLLPIRAMWDNVSPPAEKYRKIAAAMMAELKQEIRDEDFV